MGSLLSLSLYFYFSLKRQFCTSVALQGVLNAFALPAGSIGGGFCEESPLKSPPNPLCFSPADRCYSAGVTQLNPGYVGDGAGCSFKAGSSHVPQQRPSKESRWRPAGVPATAGMDVPTRAGLHHDGSGRMG